MSNVADCDDEIADIGDTAGTALSHLSLGDLDLEGLGDVQMSASGDDNDDVVGGTMGASLSSEEDVNASAVPGPGSVRWDSTPPSRGGGRATRSSVISPTAGRKTSLWERYEQSQRGLSYPSQSTRKANAPAVQGSKMRPLSSVVVLSEQDKLLHRKLDEFSTARDLGKSSSGGACQSGMDNESDAAAGGEDAQKQLSFKDLSLRDVNLIFLMPFFFRVAVVPPFMYFVIELVQMYDAKMTTVGALNAGYNLSRLIAIIGSMWKPKLCHVAGTVIGCTCYMLLIPFAQTSSIVLFSVCTIGIGLFDASGTVYIYSKEVYGNNMEKLRFAMSYQTATLGVAVVFGFLVGGIMLQYFGTRGVAVFGTIIGLVELSSLISYLIVPPAIDSEAPPGNNSEMQEEYGMDFTASTIASTGRKSLEIQDGGKIRDSIVSEISSTDSTGTGKGSGFTRMSLVSAATNEAKKKELLDRYSVAKEVVPSTFTYMVAFILSFAAIMCSNLYSIGPLFIKEQFGISEGMIGIIFSMGSAAASLFTLAALSKKGREFQNKYLRSPYNIYFLLCLGTLTALGLMIPNYACHVAMIIVVHICLETFLALITELQGAITPEHAFAILGPVAQMSSVIINMLMALTAPMLYSVHVRLPYLVSGSLCVIYTIGFVAFTRHQQKQNAKILVDLFEQAEGVDKEEAQNLVKRYNRLTVASGECLARMAQVAVMTSQRLTNVADMNAIEEEEDVSEEENNQ
mmetsp:Transcript_30769/g.73281  ORF Transcript_30769/g.73281 Transcript_30769/m.73281 type:complete len:740 (+) Transcript_30769:390-2609(+)